MKAVFNRPLDDRHDQIVLLISFLIGIATIILFRSGWFGFNTSPGLSAWDIAATLIVIGVIVFYGVFIFLTKSRTGVSIDRASDNAYYLGLIFTLVSLSISLIKMLQTSSLESSLAVNSALLPDFGLALFSTIAGIIVRIALQQARPDVSDTENDAAKELAKLMDLLQGNIQNLVGRLDGLTKQTEISMSQMLENSSRLVTDLTTEVSEVVKATTSKNEIMLSEIATSLTNLGSQSSKQIDVLLQNSKLVSGSTDALQQSLHGFNDLNHNIQSAAKNHLMLSEALHSSTEIISASFSKLPHSELMKSMEHTIDQHGRISNELADISSALGKVTRNLSETDASFRAQGEALNAISEKSNEAAVEYVDALAKSAEFLRAKKGK